MMLCSVSSCFFHISVEWCSTLHTVARKGVTSVINNPFSLSLHKREEVCPGNDHIRRKTLWTNVHPAPTVLYIPGLWRSNLSCQSNDRLCTPTVLIHGDDILGNGAHQARTSKINIAFMDRKTLPLLLPLSSNMMWSRCEGTTATGHDEKSAEHFSPREVEMCTSLDAKELTYLVWK